MSWLANLRNYWMISLAIMSLVQLNHSLNAQGDYQRYTLNDKGKGQIIRITLDKGKEYGHPILAIWLTTTDGKYIQSLYVSQTIAKGAYPHGKVEEGKWQVADRRNPATLPLWTHSRGILAPDSLYLPTSERPVPDAYTGATPYNNFILETRLDTIVKGKATLLLEINKPFDFNNYWHNMLFPENAAYKSSGQPSLLYAVTIDFDSPDNPYYLNPIGHGHPCGQNGKLYTDLSTFTTALNIIARVKVEVFPAAQ